MAEIINIVKKINPVELIRQNLVIRLSFFILIIAVCVFLLNNLIFWTISTKELLQSGNTNVQQKLSIAIAGIDHDLHAVETALDNVKWVVEESLGDEERLYDITRKVVSENEEISGCAIAFAPYFHKGELFFSPYSYVNYRGEIVSKQLGNINNNYHYLDWYQIPALLKEPVWSEPYFDEGGANMLMSTYSLPLIDKNGNVYAIFTADLTLSTITELVSAIKPYPTSFAFLISRNGTFVAHKDSSYIFTHTVFSAAAEEKSKDLFAVGKQMLDGQQGVYTNYTYQNDDSWFITYGPLKNKWSLAIVSNYDDVIDGIMHLTWVSLAFVIIFAILLFSVTRRMMKRQLKPLVKLSDSALKIARGDFNAELPDIDTHDEMSRLKDSFGYMQKSLVTYIDELKRTTSTKERIESELRIASDIQRQMVPSVFPPFPERSDLDVFAILNPAKEVGGDLYDYFIRDNKFYFIIGDVSGKGVPAAIFMAIARSAFRYVASSEDNVDLMMEKLNDNLTEGNPTNMFITMFIGKIDLLTGNFEYCNAGHNPGVLVNSGGRAEFLDLKSNLVAGVMNGFRYSGQNSHLEKDTALLFYTDGVTEAENAAKELYSEERLLSFCYGKEFASSEEFINSLLADVRSFTCGAEQNDDITMLVIKLK